jgi:hypothetical protein
MTTTTNECGTAHTRTLAYASAAVAVVAHCRSANFPDLALTDDEGLQDLVTCISSTGDRPFYLAVAELAGAKAVFRSPRDEEVLARTFNETSRGPVARKAAECVERYWPAIAFIGELLIGLGSVEARLVRSIMHPVLFADRSRQTVPMCIHSSEDRRVVPFARRKY